MSDILSDEALRDKGLDTARSDDASILVIACGALAREILALIKINDWSHIALTCLPAKLHLYPDQIPAEVEKAVRAHQGDYDQIFIAYGDCGTGGRLKKTCDRLGVSMISGPHCYSFYEGNQNFADHNDALGTFYLTDFLVRQFDAFVWKPMGLDRFPELRDDLFGHYTTLVYQAQTKDAMLDAQAKQCAKRLGLAYEYRFTGYGDLGTALSDII